MTKRTVRIDDGSPLILWNPALDDGSPPPDANAGYGIVTTLCSNPECTCTSMRIEARRVELVGKNQIELRDVVLTGNVESDGTGLELARPEAGLSEAARTLPSETASWITEQLERELHRGWFAERWRRWRGQIGDPRYPSGAPPENPDGMVYFSEVFPYEFDHTFVHDGRYYVLDDAHCLNPDCRCDEAAISFVDTTAASPVSHIRVSMSRFGTPTINGPALLKQLWERFIESGGEKVIRARFKRMRRVASQRRPAAPLPVRSAKVGRNDPCPCGSGKKYKRCCALTPQ